MNVSVCLFVCISANISHELYIRPPPVFVELPMAVARSSSAWWHCDTVRYVLPRFMDDFISELNGQE